MTPKTQGQPEAAPSLASDNAKQLASLASLTGLARRDWRSSESGRPFNHTEFAFFTTPVAGEIAPGMPMPTVAPSPRACSMRPTRPAIASMVPA